MGRRTHVELLCDAIQRSGVARPSPDQVRLALGWDEIKFTRALQRAVDDPHCGVSWGSGRRYLRYDGSERFKANGIYTDVARVIRDYWGPRQGFREIEMRGTSNRHGENGSVWTTPDLVMACFPARRESPEEGKRLHAIEVETAGGFDIRSVYQAHAQGHGADYSWVMFKESAPHPDWRRIDRLASELGIGLVSFVRSHASTTWTTRRRPERRRPSRPDATRFSEFVGRAPILNP